MQNSPTPEERPQGRGRTAGRGDVLPLGHLYINCVNFIFNGFLLKFLLNFI